MVFLPKIEICIWAKAEDLDEIIGIINSIARTGRMGDGKVFCVDVTEESVE